jgi:hypothetical protein
VHDQEESEPCRVRQGGRPAIATFHPSPTVGESRCKELRRVKQKRANTQTPNKPSGLGHTHDNFLDWPRAPAAGHCRPHPAAYSRAPVRGILEGLVDDERGQLIWNALKLTGSARPDDGSMLDGASLCCMTLQCSRVVRCTASVQTAKLDVASCFPRCFGCPASQCKSPREGCCGPQADHSVMSSPSVACRVIKPV